MWISTWHFFFIIEDNVINVKFVKLACIPKNQEVYYQYQKDRYLLYIRIKTENSELDTFCFSVNSVMDNQFCY